MVTNPYKSSSVVPCFSQVAQLKAQEASSDRATELNAVKAQLEAAQKEKKEMQQRLDR